MAGCELGEAWQTPIACLFLLCVTPTQASSGPFNRCPLHVRARMGVCTNNHTVFLVNGSPDVITYMPFRPDFLPIVFFKDI